VKRSVTVSIAGQRFAVRTDAKPQYVKDLAAFVTDKIQEVKTSGRTVTTQSLALLAAMQLADELHRLRADHDALKRRVREKSKRILSYLEREETR
jgi:cell division protein ZapA